eukprot:906966-Rhodomonas_salina.1
MVGHWFHEFWVRALYRARMGCCWGRGLRVRDLASSPTVRGLACGLTVALPGDQAARKRHVLAARVTFGVG